jgi:hypothetical protein
MFSKKQKKNTKLMAESDSLKTSANLKETDIKIRKAQAWEALWKIKALFPSKILPTKIKIEIFNAAQCIKEKTLYVYV